MKFNQTKQTTQSPSSAIGIMRFFDSDSKTPKITPELVMGITAVFIIAIIVLNYAGF